MRPHHFKAIGIRAHPNRFSPAAAFAVLTATAGLVGCNQIANAGRQCEDKTCFIEQFADCEAATYTTEKPAGGQARYQILGPSDSLCRVQMQYTANTNPAWIDKPLTMMLDAGQPFEPQMQKALQTCLPQDKPGAYECKGPLRGIASASGPTSGKTQGFDWTTDMPGSAAARLPAIADDAPRRFPVEIDGQWGYIDRAGELVVEARFEAADDFHNGLAAVKIDGSFGYINTHGEVVIKPRFFDAGAFSDGLAAVQIEDDKSPLGFIDRHGKMVISAQFRAGWGSVDRTHFVDGLAPVQESDPDPNSPYWYYGFVDRQGQWVIEPKFRDARPFSQGLAAVQQSHRWAYIKPGGTVALEGKWSDALSFAQGLAAVETKKDGHDGWAYIDKQGKVAVAPVFGTQRNSSRPDRARSFSEGLGLVYFGRPRQWQYITATTFGDEAKFTEMKGIHAYGEATPFRGGLARVVPVYRQGDRGGDTVYIDRQGNPIWSRQNSR